MIILLWNLYNVTEYFIDENLIVYYPDLISAYKGLSKEKEALEASIQCLTATDLNNGKKSFSAANKENNNDNEKADEEKQEIPHPLQSKVII